MWGGGSYPHGERCHPKTGGEGSRQRGHHLLVLELLHLLLMGIHVGLVLCLLLGQLELRCLQRGHSGS